MACLHQVNTFPYPWCSLDRPIVQGYLDGCQHRLQNPAEAKPLYPMRGHRLLWFSYPSRALLLFIHHLRQPVLLLLVESLQRLLYLVSYQWLSNCLATNKIRGCRRSCRQETSADLCWYVADICSCIAQSECASCKCLQLGMHFDDKQFSHSINRSINQSITFPVFRTHQGSQQTMTGKWHVLSTKDLWQ